MGNTTDCDFNGFYNHSCSQLIPGILHHHVALSWCLIFIDKRGEIVYQREYIGPKAGVKLLEAVLDAEEHLKTLLAEQTKYVVPPRLALLSLENQRDFLEATHCSICGLEFTEQSETGHFDGGRKEMAQIFYNDELSNWNDRRVLDHSHWEPDPNDAYRWVFTIYFI